MELRDWLPFLKKKKPLSPKVYDEDDEEMEQTLEKTTY